MELQAGSEPMTLGSPTSPKAGTGAQFLPGFLMGDVPAPASPQPRTFSHGGPESRNFSLGGPESRGPLGSTGGSPPLPVVPAPKDKSGAPPVRSIYDDLAAAATAVSTPLNAHRQPFSSFQSPFTGHQAATPTGGVPLAAGCSSSGKQQVVLSPAQVDPFYSQGEALSSDDQLDQTWVTVFGFPPASSSYILLQFAQYGNILKHTMSSPGNWMHLQFQSKLQARKALSKDGKVFGGCIMVGVKPCIDKSVMDSPDGSSPLGPHSSSHPPPTPVLPSTPRSSMRPLSAAYQTSSSDYQVVTDKVTPRKDDGFVSKAMEYMFGW